jgi:excinuclease UvrABC nuclease subunit
LPKNLLKHFGSVRKIKEASFVEVEKLIGKANAIKLEDWRDKKEE